MIANHALYFAHLAAGGGVLPEHDAVVFDEAHRLEESAASWLGGRVSRAGLRRLALDVERACRDGQKPLPRESGRPGRARRRASAARRRAAVRAAPLARRSCRGGARADRRARRSRDRAARARARISTRSARRALGVAAQVEACLELGRARSGRLVRAGRARVGAGRASPTSCASGCGRKARPRSSSPRR